MRKVRLISEIKSIEDYYNAQLIAEVLVDEEIEEVIRYKIVEKTPLSENQFTNMVKRLNKNSWKLYSAIQQERKPIINEEIDKNIMIMLQSFLTNHDQTLIADEDACDAFIKQLVENDLIKEFDK